MNPFANFLLTFLALAMGPHAGVWGNDLFLKLPEAEAPDPARVVVVANSAFPESRELARFYMERRSIPERNLIAFRMPEDELINYLDFVRDIFNPLLAELTAKGFLDAIPSDLEDHYGRKRFFVSGHEVDYLVLMRGVPVRIEMDDAAKAKANLASAPERFKTLRASVDGELAMLPTPNWEPAGIQKNPLFSNKAPGTFDLQRMLKVARLDAPEADHVRSMIDGAIHAETHGLMGRAYIDARGPFASANQWMERVAREARMLGYDVDLRREEGTFPAGVRFDAPALYFGWYTYHVNGPFREPGMRFAPGAIAVHLHSFSARPLRNANQAWTGPMIARGAAASIGNVWEPYLQFTHHLDKFFIALRDGWTLGDAAYFALPALSWQATLVGDPLYRPFRVSIDEQIANLGSPETTAWGQYAVIRKMNLITQGGGSSEFREGVEFASGMRFRANGLALTHALAQKYQSLGDRNEAGRILKPIGMLTYVDRQDVPILKDVANSLADLGDHATAAQVYVNIANTGGLPVEEKRTILAKAAVSADIAGATTLRSEISRMQSRLAQ